MKKWLNTALTVFLIIAILVTIGAIIYLINTPNPNNQFTEFYILGLGGKAENYPGKMKLGESAQVIVGVVNHEQQAMTYRLEVLIADIRSGSYNPFVMNDEEKLEQQVTITPTKVGDNQKVQFNLYKRDSTTPSLQLHLWIDVSK